MKRRHHGGRGVATRTFPVVLLGGVKYKGETVSGGGPQLRFSASSRLCHHFHRKVGYLARERRRAKESFGAVLCVTPHKGRTGVVSEMKLRLFSESEGSAITEEMRAPSGFPENELAQQVQLSVRVLYALRNPLIWTQCAAVVANMLCASISSNLGYIVCIKRRGKVRVGNFRFTYFKPPFTINRTCVLLLFEKRGANIRLSEEHETKPLTGKRLSASPQTFRSAVRMGLLNT